MVQNTIEGFFSRLENALANLLGILPFALLVLGLALVLSLVLYTIHRDGFLASRDWLIQQLKNALPWLPMLVVLMVVFFGIKIAQYSVGLRYVSQNNARYSKLEDPPGHDTVQPEPSLGFTEVKTYTRSIRVPPDALKRLDQEGRDAILPYVEQYLADPQSRNVKNVVDSIVKMARACISCAKPRFSSNAAWRFRAVTSAPNLNLVIPVWGVRFTAPVLTDSTVLRIPTTSRSTLFFTFRSQIILAH